MASIIAALRATREDSGELVEYHCYVYRIDLNRAVAKPLLRIHRSSYVSHGFLRLFTHISWCSVLSNSSSCSIVIDFPELLEVR
jgi:hypothetical protein